ncbi:tyrosine-type recombinase/integrase [Pantoea sp. EEL5]|uniref:tyrosine-type recombinase/integrase n=1 Tax=Pantoea sp. EEL5 TaxID=3416806 RepID=UPI003CF1A94F
MTASLSLRWYREDLALWKYPEVSLADARAHRDEARRLLANGVDPSENKKAVKVELEQEEITFEVVARDWHASNKKWSASHSARALKSLEDNLFAAIGKRNITELKTRDLLVPIKAVESSGDLKSPPVYSSVLPRLCALLCRAV